MKNRKYTAHLSRRLSELGDRGHVCRFASARCARRRLAAFTLLELLVVIAIIGILAALLMPAAAALRDSARRKQAKAEAMSVVKAAKQYRQTYGRYPAQTQGDDDRIIESEDL